MRIKYLTNLQEANRNSVERQQASKASNPIQLPYETVESSPNKRLIQLDTFKFN